MANRFRVISFIIIFKLIILSAGLVLALFIPMSGQYNNEYHHYFIDQRLTIGRLDFFELWSYGDAQWYLDIAQNGYSLKADDNRSYNFTGAEPQRKFAFFPLWPIIIRSFGVIFRNFNISAFLATNIISFFAFYYFYKLILVYFKNEKLAFRSLMLLMFFPFSVFFHLYYAESLFLLLSVLVFYFLKQDKWPSAYLAAFFLVITKAIGALIFIPIIVFLLGKIYDAKKNGFYQPKDLHLRLLGLPLIGAGVFLYSVFNYAMTRDWLYFYHVLEKWQQKTDNIFINILQNFSWQTLINFSNLDFHAFHSSKVDYIMMLIFAILLIFGYRRLPKELFIFSFLVWLAPLISRDLMSFSRYMIVSFPIFICLGGLLKKDYLFYPVLIIFEAGYLFALIGVISWRWVG